MTLTHSEIFERATRFVDPVEGCRGQLRVISQSRVQVTNAGGHVLTVDQIVSVCLGCNNRFGVMGGKVHWVETIPRDRKYLDRPDLALTPSDRKLYRGLVSLADSDGMVYALHPEVRKAADLQARTEQVSQKHLVDLGYIDMIEEGVYEILRQMPAEMGPRELEARRWDRTISAVDEPAIELEPATAIAAAVAAPRPQKSAATAKGQRTFLS